MRVGGVRSCWCQSAARRSTGVAWTAAIMGFHCPLRWATAGTLQMSAATPAPTVKLS